MNTRMFARLSVHCVLYAVGAFAHASRTHLYLPPRLEVLRPCASQLSETQSDFLRGLIRRFGNFTIIDDERLGHHRFQVGDGRGPSVTYELPDLMYGQDQWTKERWVIHPDSESEQAYCFLDAGLRKLFEDGEQMNAVVSPHLLTSNAVNLEFTSSAMRRRDLERLNTFRWACHERVMQRYRDHRGKARYLGPLDYRQFRLADRNNLNVDVLAVADVMLSWDADHSEIFDAVRSHVQLTYDAPFDPMRPTLDGLLLANNERSTAARTLPHFERLDPARKDDYLRSFWEAHGHLSTCEITRHINTNLPEPVVDRLIYQAFQLARLRGCQIMFASVDPVTFRRFKRKYGFERDRPIPTLGSADESLAYLRVSSPIYFTKLEELRVSGAAILATKAE